MSATFVTDRTSADVTARNAKGVYTHTDLNRVGEAIAEIATLFNANGVTVSVNPKTDWTADDTPNVTQMAAYLTDINTLRVANFTMDSTPDTPASMALLDYLKANDIEQILSDIYTTVTGMILMYRRLGTFYLGE